MAGRQLSDYLHPIHSYTRGGIWSLTARQSTFIKDQYEQNSTVTSASLILRFPLTKPSYGTVSADKVFHYMS